MNRVALSLLALGLAGPACVSVKKQNQAASRVDLGSAYLRESNPQDAVRTLREATKLDPGNADAWQKLGLAYMALDADEESEAAFGKAVRLEPSRAEFRNNYGLLLMKMERYPDAIEQFEAGKDDLEYRRMALLLNNLGRAQHLAGNSDAAIKELTDAIKRAPNLCQPIFNRAEVYRSAGRNDEALADYEDVIELCGDDVPGAYYHAAQVLLEKERVDDACRLLGNAVAASMGTELETAAHELVSNECP